MNFQTLLCASNISVNHALKIRMCFYIKYVLRVRREPIVTKMFVTIINNDLITCAKIGEDRFTNFYLRLFTCPRSVVKTVLLRH